MDVPVWIFLSDLGDVHQIGLHVCVCSQNWSQYKVWTLHEGMEDVFYFYDELFAPDVIEVNDFIIQNANVLCPRYFKEYFLKIDYTNNWVKI